MRSMQENTMRKWRARLAARLLASGLALAAPLMAMAENSIRSITSTQQAGTDVVRIELAEPLTAVPSGFAVQAPPRVALDLPAVANGMGRNTVDINQGNLRSVAVAQTGERTRLVLNLRQAASYRAELQGKVLVVVLDGGAAPQAVASTGEATHFAKAENTEALPLRDIDFRRGADGAGRIVVALASTQVGVDIRQQGQSLVVEFLRSSLPATLRRRLDVTDFGTPVQSVSAFQSGDRVRMMVEPKGAWEHSAYQSDNQFVLEVRPVKTDPNKLTQGPGFGGQKLSLNFQNIEIRALLQVIADFTDFNVVTSDTVTGNVTLRLKDVPWDQALDIILQSKGLGVKKSGNVLWIAPKDELSAKEQLDLEAKKKLADLEPLRTQAFQLNYTKAEEVAKGLSGQNTSSGSSSSGGSSAAQTQRILSPRGSVLFETRTNQLFVSDIPSKLEEIMQLIAKIDIPVRQVLIEARIVEADDKFGRALGVKLGAVDLRGLAGGVPGASVGGGNYVQIGSNYTTNYKQLGVMADNTITDVGTQMVSLPANTSALGSASAATLALSLFSPSANRILNLELSALEADGKGKIVSSPRVITADQGKAIIEQGEEIPYQVASSSGATSIQFKKASLKLEVTPQITPEGSVIMDLDVAKDSRGANTTAGPAINTKHAKTQVLVENGGTVVIGGIFTQDERTDVNKVPFLGDVPVVGNLFKNTTKYTNKTELLIFITPKIVTERAQVR
ncbi:type IV pilus secretin PilQ [Aquabacterium sp. OR-4]|uniref:type IV pilus secretin PilQ n=1 Tax=Aquabacterium sp. OR-4 TaxID=2978127 RepID=UPI0028C8125D|nr:type IV pilus secretin PilQ [Aquabacterium sp. OR-4]MDT7837572.1 type IV pilus secretin PilQ [Aquabacterium sp. OR-4]